MLPPFLYYSQVYLRLLHNQLMKQRYSFLGMYVNVVRNWVLWDILHFGVLSHAKKRYQMSLSAQTGCAGVEYRLSVVSVVNQNTILY